jgi:hypothetical protein
MANPEGKKKAREKSSTTTKPTQKAQSPEKELCIHKAYPE